MLVAFTLKKMLRKKISVKDVKNSLEGSNCAFSFGNEQGKVSQLKISKVSGISAVTIRNRSKEIKRIMGGEING